MGEKKLKSSPASVRNRTGPASVIQNFNWVWCCFCLVKELLPTYTEFLNIEEPIVISGLASSKKEM